MIGYHREPTLEEILSDSVTRAVMEADGVDRQELEAMLRQAGRNLPPLRGGERLVRSPCRAVGPPNKSLVPLRLSSPAFVQSSIEPRLVESTEVFTTDDDSHSTGDRDGKRRGSTEQDRPDYRSLRWNRARVDTAPCRGRLPPGDGRT